MSRKLIFINTHPIQYFAPLYKHIEGNGSFDLEVWYCSKHGLGGELDKQFGTNVKWDIPVLEGYKYKFFDNNSWKPGLYNGFFGLINLGIINALYKLPAKSIVVVHGWFPFSNVLALIFSRLFGNITCLRAETPLIHEVERSKKSLFIRTILLRYFLFLFPNKFLYIGEQNRKFYEYYGVSQKALIRVPYAVDNERFQKASNELQLQKAIIRKELGIKENSFVILFSGKYISKKNPLDLLQAIALLKNKNIFCVFVGDGELKTSMESSIEKENLKDQTLLTGFVNQTEIPKYYAMADLFVMCSGVGETWGLSTNEAMNFGLPVLISDKVGNVDDLVKGNGFKFIYNNVESLANGINKIFSLDQKELHQMKIESQILVNKYSFNEILNQLLKI